MDTDLDPDYCNPKYPSTISSDSSNSNTNTASSISQIQNNLRNQNHIVEYNTNQPYQDLYH